MAQVQQPRRRKRLSNFRGLNSPHGRGCKAPRTVESNIVTCAADMIDPVIHEGGMGEGKNSDCESKEYWWNHAQMLMRNNTSCIVTDILGRRIMRYGN